MDAARPAGQAVPFGLARPVPGPFGVPWILKTREIKNIDWWGVKLERGLCRKAHLRGVRPILTLIDKYCYLQI